MTAKSVVAPGLLLLASALLVLAGCGGASNQDTAPNRRTTSATPVISLGNPVLASVTIPPKFRCSNGVWLPLRWRGLPEGTTELVLYVAGYGEPRSSGPGTTFTLVVSESLTVGLDPSSQQLSVGAVPPGAQQLVERGVDACPARNAEKEYLFRLFALDRRHQVPRNLIERDDVAAILDRLYAAEVPYGQFTAQH